MKNLLRMTLTLMLFTVLFLCIGQTASAESGTWGNLSWTLEEGGTLTISGNGVMNDFILDSTDAWRYLSDNIITINIKQGVTSIGNFAFEGCTKVTGVTIPNSVTSIGAGAFAACVELNSVTIPDSVDDIRVTAFAMCFSLTSISIPEGVTNIGEAAFDGCSELTDIHVDPSNKYYCDLDGVLFTKDMTALNEYPEGKRGSYTVPSGVIRINNRAFSGCGGLSSITIPKSVTSIGDYAFWRCSELVDVYYEGTFTQWQQIQIGDYNGSLQDASIHCLTIEDTWGNLTWTLDPNGLLTIFGDGKIDSFNKNDSFSAWRWYKRSIKTVVIEPGVTYIGSYAFSDCSGLTSVTIPDSVTSIGSNAFSNCSGLTSVTIPSSVVSIGEYAFRNCNGLIAVHINDLTSWCNIHFLCSESLTGHHGTCYSNPLMYAKKLYLQGELITDLVIPDGVINIRDSAFNGCNSLTSVTIPESVIKIGDNAFEDCYSLTRVTIPESLTSIGEYAFSDCSSLTDVTIPKNVTSIGARAFQDCYSLTNITIMEGVTSIGSYAFYDCFRLASVAIPNGVTSISNYTFYGCKGLTTVILPESVNSIRDYAFYGCNGLKSVIMPKRLLNIGSYAFYGCGLTSLMIPENVTNIGNYAFYGSNLRNVMIPASVMSIGHYAFGNCFRMTDVYYGGTEEQWTALLKAVGEGNEPLTNASIHFYPSSADLILPGALTNIGEEAFSCGAFTYVELSEKVTNIEKNAFANCSNLAYIYIPAETIDIDPFAFGDMRGLTMLGKANSSVETYAGEHGFAFIAIS